MSERLQNLTAAFADLDVKARSNFRPIVTIGARGSIEFRQEMIETLHSPTSESERVVSSIPFKPKSAEYAEILLRGW